MPKSYYAIYNQPPSSINDQQRRNVYLINVHVSMSFLQSLCRLSHSLEHSRVRVGPLQRLPLLLNCRQGPVDLLKLPVVPLLAFQSLFQRKKRG